MDWPQVHNEYETVAKLTQGFSIARFGDGELKLMNGAAQIREPQNDKLGKELRSILQNPHAKCLVGIPTMDPNGPKFKNWSAHRGRYMDILESARPYWSAFISRPDSAPWIMSREYAEQLCSIWRDKRVALVSERTSKIFTLAQKTVSGKLVHVPCPHEKTYSQIDDIEQHIVKAKPDIALLSCGPAATCLAHRLTKKGLQAIDVGSMGGFMLKALGLEPTGYLTTVVLRRPTQQKGVIRPALEQAGFSVVYCSEDADSSDD